MRFYQWATPAITIGRNQDLEEEINLILCNELGIKYIRRITGGGAVFHDSTGEIAYSIVINQDKNTIDIKNSFGLLCRGILKALEGLNINASQSLTQYTSIFVNGKKISGNAQTRKSNVILHHGTLLKSVNKEQMYSVLNASKPDYNPSSVKSEFNEVTSIDEELQNSHVDFNSIISQIIKGYTREMAIEFKKGQLTDQEMRLSNSLVQKKYSTDEWNFFKRKRS